MYLCYNISKRTFYALLALHYSELKFEFESKLVSCSIAEIWPTGMAQDMLVDHTQSFSSFSHILDARILRALAEQGFARPTLVQAKAIPLALEGRDILARARTGSGKTAAYCIPLVQKILNVKSVGLPLSGCSLDARLGKAKMYAGYQHCRSLKTGHQSHNSCSDKRVGGASFESSQKFTALLRGNY